MLVSVLSTMTAKRLLRYSIYTLKNKRRGERIEIGQDLSLLEKVHVADVMERDFPHVTRDTPFAKVLQTLDKSKMDMVPVLDENGDFYGIIGFHQVRTVIHSEALRDLIIAEDVTLRSPITVTPSANLADVFTELGMLDINSLPVVSDEDPKKLVGVIARSSIVSRYRKEVILESEAERSYSFFPTAKTSSNKS
jgi:CIC family chloride channel protein